MYVVQPLKLTKPIWGKLRRGSSSSAFDFHMAMGRGGESCTFVQGTNDVFDRMYVVEPTVAWRV